MLNCPHVKLFVLQSLFYNKKEVHVVYISHYKIQVKNKYNKYNSIRLYERTHYFVYNSSSISQFEQNGKTKQYELTTIPL